MITSARPRIHLTPPSGWMNDPNGLVLLDGRMHVFYQYEPDAPRWGRMRWGHAVSSDLLHWEHLPVALEPDADGPDALGCWSGCLVRDDDGTPTILYTGVAMDGDLRRASVCLATGDPGLERWTKAGPVLSEPPPGIRPDMFRDPFAWRAADGWAMLVGAGTRRSRGAVLLYRSPDLRSWTYAGPFLTTEALVAACPDLDVGEIDGACWECPQLLPAGDDWILIVSIVDRSPLVRPAHVVAIVGRIDGGHFVPRHAERLGLGPDFYAPATLSLPDGRGLLFGWIPEDPPDETQERSWAGALTLPRVVSLDALGRPTISMAAETASLGRVSACWSAIEIRDEAPWEIHLEDGHAELRLTLEPDGSAAIRIDVLVAGELVADIRFDPRNRRLTATRIGRVLVAGLTPHGMAILPPDTARRLDLRIILDGSILELVAADRVTATVRLPTAADGRTISCTTFGGSCRIVEAELRLLDRPGPGGAFPKHLVQ